MEQQDHESFFSPKGIPAFASIIIFLVSFFIVMSLFHSVLNLFSVVRGYGMGYFFIGEGIMLLSVFIVTFLMMRFLDRRPFSDWQRYSLRFPDGSAHLCHWFWCLPADRAD